MFLKFSTRQDGEVLINPLDIIWAGFTSQGFGLGEACWAIRLSNYVLDLAEAFDRTPFLHGWVVLMISKELNHWVFVRPESIAYIPLNVYRDGRARVNLTHGGCLILDGQDELDDLLSQKAIAPTNNRSLEKND